MKRKLCLVLLIVIAISSAVCCLSACDGDKVGELQMNKKYILEDDIREEENIQDYYLFNSDGTGEYRYYHIYDYNPNRNVDQTIKFKYTYADEDKSAVVCFFDSVKYGRDNVSKAYTDWRRLLTISKNVICFVDSSGYSYYINEDYLENIPNFGS